MHFGVKNGKILSCDILTVSLKQEFWRENSNFHVENRKTFELLNFNNFTKTKSLTRKFKLFFSKYVKKIIKIFDFGQEFLGAKIQTYRVQNGKLLSFDQNFLLIFKSF